MLGGICTIIFALVASGLFCLNMYNNFKKPVFHQDKTDRYLSYENNHEYFNMTTDHQQITGALLGSDSQTDNNLRIQFYSDFQSEPLGPHEHTWHQAVYCKDLYAKQIQEEQEPGFVGEKFLADEFVNTHIDYVCPNVTDIKLWSDPFNYGQGQNFVMVINSCEVAQQIDIDNDIVSYAD